MRAPSARRQQRRLTRGQRRGLTRCDMRRYSAVPARLVVRSENSPNIDIGVPVSTAGVDKEGIVETSRSRIWGEGDHCSTFCSGIWAYPVNNVSRLWHTNMGPEARHGRVVRTRKHSRPSCRLGGENSLGPIPAIKQRHKLAFRGQSPHAARCRHQPVKLAPPQMLQKSMNNVILMIVGETS